MKKLIALLLVIANLGVLAACDKKDAGDSKSDNKATETSKKKSNSEVEDTGVKISSDLSAGSVFSDGLALVEVDGEKDKTYCINKKGNIVFEVDEDISVDGMLDPFENGYLVIGYGDKNCLYNEKGEITYPEDVGVTGFSSIAIEDGYIIVEKVTADYSSTKKELGVMDLDFNWIVKPSEELYKSFENCMLRHGVTYMYEGSGIAYCHGGYLCCFDDGCYLNLKTGEVTKEPPFDTPSKAWHGGYDANYITMIMETICLI